MKPKIDPRRLPIQTLEEKRRMSHELRKIGMTRKEIGAIVGVHADTVGRWLKPNERDLSLKKRGRKPGSLKQPSDEHEKKVKRLIIDKTPDQLKLDYALWARQSVRESILQEIGIELSVRTVGNYLKPSKGKTPVIRVNANSESINMISAVTNQGKVRFRIFEGTMNADVLIDFMMRLINKSDKKVFLILDNFRVHHCESVKEWLENHKHMIEVFYLQAYSPELNPDEYLNCDLKEGVHSGVPARNKDQLKKT